LNQSQLSRTGLYRRLAPVRPGVDYPLASGRVEVTAGRPFGGDPAILREYSNLYIDGRWHEAQSTDVLDVISPRWGERIGSVPAASKADIDAAVEAAHKAFYETDWAQRPGRRARGALPQARHGDQRTPEGLRRAHRRGDGLNFLADVYQSTAPTLHWNYYAEVGEHYDFSEVRMADLSRLASGAEGGSVIPYAGESLADPGGYLNPQHDLDRPVDGASERRGRGRPAGSDARLARGDRPNVPFGNRVEQRPVLFSARRSRHGSPDGAL
jgi:hypothetical protein